MAHKVNIKLSIPREMYVQMKHHTEIDWNEAAISGIVKQLAASGVIIGRKSHQNPKLNHHKL